MNNSKAPGETRNGGVSAAVRSPILLHLTIGFIYAVMAYYFSNIGDRDLSAKIWAAIGGMPDKGHNFFTLAWNLKKLASGLEGYWDLPIFYPLPNILVGFEPYFGVGVLALPFYLFSHNFIFAHNMVYIANNFLAAVGMYLLCLRLTKNVPAAFLAGVMFAFTPVRTILYNGPVYHSSQYFPWIFWAVHRFADRQYWRDALLISFFLALQAATCGTYGVYAASGVTVAVIYLTVSRREYANVKYWLKLAAAAVFTLILLWPLFYPYLTHKSTLAYMYLHKPPISGPMGHYDDLVTLLASNFTFWCIFTSALLIRDISIGKFPGWPAFLLIMSYFTYHYGKMRLDQGVSWPRIVTKTAICYIVLFGFIAALVVYANYHPKHIRSVWPPPAWPWVNLIILTAFWTALLAWGLWRARPYLARLDETAKLHLFIAALFLITSMGPVATFWGYPVTLTPFWIFFYIFPGYIYIATSNRMVIVAITSLFVLAAMGFTTLTDSLLKRNKLIVYLATAILASMVYFGSWVLFTSQTPADLARHFAVRYKQESDAEILRVYEWLAQQKFDGCILELPQKYGDPLQGVYYVFATTHWQPNLIGYISYLPYEGNVTLNYFREFPSENSIAHFRAKKLKYIIYHRRNLTDDEWVEAEAALKRFSDDIRPMREFGTDLVYEVVYE